MLHHDVNLCQYSSSHLCGRPSAISTIIYIYIYIYIYNWCSCSEALVAIFWHSYVVVCYICQYFERFIPHYACHYTSHSFANGHLQGIFTSLHFKLKVSSSFHLGFEGDLSVLCKSHLSHVDILY